MPKTTSERAQKYRAARREEFAEECRRQSLLLHNDPQEHGINAWLATAADTTDWE